MAVYPATGPWQQLAAIESKPEAMAATQGARSYLSPPYEAPLCRGSLWSDERLSFKPAAACSGRAMASKLEVCNGGTCHVDRLSFTPAVPSSGRAMASKLEVGNGGTSHKDCASLPRALSPSGRAMASKLEVGNDSASHSDGVSFIPAVSSFGSKLEVSNGGKRQRARVCVMSSLPDGSMSLVTHKPSELEEPYYWPHFSPSALQRIMLESQWIQSLDRPLHLLDANASSESIAMTQNVVSSGRASARQRRLNARVPSAAAPSKRLDVSTAPLPDDWRQHKQNRIKAEEVQDFLTSYMKYALKVDLLTKEEEVQLSQQLRIGQRLSRVRNQLKKELGHEPSYGLWAESVQMSTRELFTKIAEGEQAREKMTLANIRLVVAVAKNYQNQGVDLADLIQEGSMGLIRGLMKYDHTKGFKVSTYVHWWIRQGVTRAIAEHSRIMRLPVHMHEKLFRINRLKAQLRAEKKTMSLQEISESLGITRESVELAFKANRRALSLDKKRRIGNSIGESGSTMHDILPDINTENEPWAAVDRDDLREDLKILMSSLTQVEKDVLLWLHGLGAAGGYCWTLQGIGDRYGISKERVRQIKQRAMQKIQEQLIHRRDILCM